MIKVLQILSGLNRGGMEAFVMNVYRSIDKSAIQFDFLVGTEGGAYEEEAKQLGATIYHIGTRREHGLIRYCEVLDKFFKEHATDYIAVHYHESTLTSLEPLYFARKYGIKNRLLHAHSSSVSGSKLHYFTHYFNKLFVKNLATQYVGCSYKANQWFYRGTGVYEKAEMIANGINTESYIPNDEKRIQLRKILGINQKDLVLGHIGRFIWIKNHKFLIDIFDCVHKKQPASKLVLIGEGPLFEDIKTNVLNRGLDNYVLFLGSRSDVPDLLQAIDVIIMPSFYEGMPVSLIEAQASGTLVYGSDTISKDTAITDRMNFLSIKDSAEVWADAILLNENFHKTSKKEEILKAGFDIASISKDLSDRYLRIG